MTGLYNIIHIVLGVRRLTLFRSNGHDHIIGHVVINLDIASVCVTQQINEHRGVMDKQIAC
jgi:hypothetical protein